MYRKALIDFLNKYQFIQFIFVIMPIIIGVVYGYAYMTDMLGIARNLEYNNGISEDAWNYDELLEVSYFEDGETTHAVVDSGFSDEVVVKVDDVIFYVQMYNTEWYQLVTASDASTFMTRCSLFDAVANDAGDGATVTHDDISLDFEYGDLVCAVTISESGDWRVSFLVDDLPHYDLDELYMLEYLSSSADYYTVRVHSRYELNLDDFEVNFCTNLPNDSLYYNESTASFVRNISKDYPWTFMLRSNIGIVLLSELMYCMLLWRASQEKKLELLKNDTFLRVDFFAGCLLVLYVPFTLIML